MRNHITSPQTQKEIKAFAENLKAFYWKNDYKQFCKILGFSEGPYSLDKYAQFENLCKALNTFDINSLLKLIEAGAMAEQK